MAYENYSDSLKSAAFDYAESEFDIIDEMIMVANYTIEFDADLASCCR